VGFVATYSTLGTEPGALVTRHDTPRDASRRGVVHSHAAGGDALDLLSPDLAAIRGVAEALPDLLNIANDLTDPMHWGNPASQTKMGDSVSYLQGTGGAKTGKVLMVAASMGALATLNYARANPTKVAALALIVPATHLDYIHDNNATYTAAIETAYGGAVAYEAAQAANDPGQHAAAYSGLFPMCMWRASNDTTVFTAKQDEFAAASGCTVVNLGAVGHTDQTVDVTAVAAFLRTYA
jgi:predicted alpha/beta hydrolase family esterase